MSDNKNPLDEPYPVALYKSLKFGSVIVSHYYGENDAEYHGDNVRISEPIECRFSALTNDAVIQNALSSLDAEERKARIDLERRLAEIREFKSQLLALTFQPEAA